MSVEKCLICVRTQNETEASRSNGKYMPVPSGVTNTVNKDTRKLNCANRLAIGQLGGHRIEEIH